MAELKIKADSGGGTVSLKGPATTTSNAAVQLTLPVDDGTTGQYLKTDGSGALSWSTVDTSIADDSIVEAKLDISNAPTNGQFLQAQSGEGGGLTWASANTPAFSVTKSGDQSISQNTWTKVEWETEQFDTDNAFDNTNDKFTVPTGKGGVYQLNVQVCVTNQTENAELDLKVYKNGSATSTPSFSREYAGTSGNSNNTTQHHHLYDLDAGDYLEIYVFTGSGGSYVIESDSSCWSMFKLAGTS